MASSKDKKSYTGTSKRYTTRQIMALTEKRRKEMDEQMRREQMEALKASEIKAEPQPLQEQAQAVEPDPVREVPVVSITRVDDQGGVPPSDKKEEAIRSFREAISNFTNQVANHPARFEFPAQVSDQITSETQEAPNNIEKTSEETPLAVDGKSVSSFFRDEPQNPTEQAVSDLIEREFDKAVSNAAPSDQALQIDVELQPVQEKEDPAAVSNDGVTVPWRERLPAVMDWLFIALSSVLLVLMFAHLVMVGWNHYYYDQSSFVLMMGLSVVWFNRRYVERRSEWFLGASVIIAGGLGVYFASVLEGRVYLEMAGFIVTCFGLFLWRYTQESAARLFFPLVCLLFMLAPPDLWEKMLEPRLNHLVFSFSADILNSFHLPVLFEQGRFYVGPGVVDSSGDPTAYRLIVSSMALAAVCVSFQNMAGVWSFVLFSSVVLWGIIGNIVRVTVTGLMLENFGVEYASMFFVEYSVAVLMVVMLAGLTLTAGFLPHKEDVE